ncbi:integral membrane protein DUF92-domain-containing protein [Pyronema omphalodes]|nr:integral membrane protein DUF92-domain-containing protein [Pyronema omphalodes]
MNPLLFFPALALLVVRAIQRNSLTPAGILAAIVTAGIHGYHPSALPFTLLITFYTLGTVATKIKHDVKSRLTISSTGASSTARNATQVFANSIVATALTAAHIYTGEEVYLIGVITNYAATTADTLSSELGILSTSQPILITTLRRCPPGTNGGISLFGLVAGAAGAGIIGVVSSLLLRLPLLPLPAENPLTPGGHALATSSALGFTLFITITGTLGSLLDSLLGAIAQESVVDMRTGKVVEAPGGGRVLIEPNVKVLSPVGKMHSKLGHAPQGAGEAVGVVGDDGKATKTVKVKKETARAKGMEGKKEKDEGSRKKIGGLGWLTNNGVNFTMAALMSLAAMVWWGF